LVPDATGIYSYYSYYNGKPYFVTAGAGYFIWWDGVDSWIISDRLGIEGTAYWTRTDPDIEGVYTACGTATGEATVAPS